MFAALQVASRSCTFLVANKANIMVEKLRGLIHTSPDDETSHTETYTIQHEYGENRSATSEQTKAIKTLFEEVEMPWLVPACSEKYLKNAFDKCGEQMFKGNDWRIAGLVPGERGALLDAKAFLWVEGMPVDWVFEFKAHSSKYSLDEGVKALNTKCEGTPDSHGSESIVFTISFCMYT